MYNHCLRRGFTFYQFRKLDSGRSENSVFVRPQHNGRNIQPSSQRYAGQ
jgi:hypothetical protein